VRVHVRCRTELHGSGDGVVASFILSQMTEVLKTDHPVFVQCATAALLHALKQGTALERVGMAYCALFSKLAGREDTTRGAEDNPLDERCVPLAVPRQVAGKAFTLPSLSPLLCLLLATVSPHPPSHLWLACCTTSQGGSVEAHSVHRSCVCGAT